jgi:hypothetical protein
MTRSPVSLFLSVGQGGTFRFEIERQIFMARLTLTCPNQLAIVLKSPLDCNRRTAVVCRRLRG